MGYKIYKPQVIIAHVRDLWIEKDFVLIVPLESRDFESEISQHPCYKLQTRHEDIQGFKHLMPSRYFGANSNYVWKPETLEGLKIWGGGDD